MLALDIALRRTGWAVGWPGMQRPYWGVHDNAGDWDGREGERLHAWRRFLEARLAQDVASTISAIVAPSGRRSISITIACLVWGSPTSFSPAT